MTEIPRLYKYLPERYVKQYVERGVLLFRNLTYFRQLEEKGRADLLEGLHMDFPDNDIELRSVDGPGYYKGRGAYLRSVKQDRLFVHCLSFKHCEALYAEFQADSCIEVFDVDEFLRRCDQKISSQPRFAESGLLRDQVEYYLPNQPVASDITNPKRIPFFKHASYLHQEEFRLAAALRGGLEIIQRIIMPGFSFEAEVLAGQPDQRTVVVGPLSDIVRVHSLNSRRVPP